MNAITTRQKEPSYFRQLIGGFKTIIGLNGGLDEWSASRQDGTNFRTNTVSLAEFEDSGAASEGGVLGLAAAWACVNLLTGTQASLPLMVYRAGANGQREVARDHPLFWLLHDSPNADQTAYDFWEFVTACLEMRGNAYCEVERAGDGRVIALGVPIPPQVVAVRRANGSLEYEWTLDNRPRTERQDRILHIRGFGGSPLGGLSALGYGRRVFGGAMAVEKSARAMFANGMRPSVTLETDVLLSGDKRLEVEAILEEKYIGAANTGRPFLSDNGLKVKPLSFNAEDSQMLQSRAFGVEQICMFFGVPPHMIGHTEKTTSWGTGIEQQTLGFVKFTLRSRLKRIEQALMKQLLTAKDRTQGITIEFNLEGLLRGDSKTRADFYASGLQNGWRTINEVRELENLPPVEGGDVPRMQMQNVPITEAGGIAPPEDVQ